jgi:DNA-binding NarL/FixJ family response regulator
MNGRSGSGKRSAVARLGFFFGYLLSSRSMATKHRLFVLEDHPVVLEGYISILEGQTDFEVCGWAADGLEAFEAIERLKPDLAIIDVSVPGMNGLELVKQVSALHSGVAMLVISAHDEGLYAERALRAGAMGYLMKHNAPRVIVEAVRHVLQGKVYTSERMRAAYLDRYLDRIGDKPASPLSGLSDRELEVFEHLGRGKTTQEIAEEMHISPKTVVTYRGNLKEKLNLDNSAALMRRAVIWVEREFVGA